nr:hypothetical protein [Pelagibacterales bacterium]
MSNTKNHYSISSLVKLIDNGKLNSSISCRGGFGASYVQFVFVKTAKDKLSVFRSSSFDTSPQEYRDDNKPPMITKSGITFYSDSSKHNRWYLYFLDTFITIGDFDSNGCKLLPIKTPWKIDARYIQCT